jgi:hypothetical protein
VVQLSKNRTLNRNRLRTTEDAVTEPIRIKPGSLKTIMESLTRPVLLAKSNLQRLRRKESKVRKRLVQVPSLEMRLEVEEVVKVDALKLLNKTNLNLVILLPRIVSM